MATDQHGKLGLPLINPELEPFIVANVHETGKGIGTGAYGSVEEVEMPGARVAAKKLHPGLVNFGSEQQVRRWIADFIVECQLMSSLRHPHIVQFLGICYLPGSPLPVLLMEKLEISLDSLLETYEKIPLQSKVSLLLGTARGVVFLHSYDPAIIHRDLTARNILIDSGLIAKIADLGVARILRIQSGRLAATMTTAPGNILYMPPEAIGDGPTRYNTAIDIFSFGNVALFTLTQVFPQDLKSATYLDPDTQRIVGRSEIERREEYIQLLFNNLGKEHPLVQLTLRCLEYNPQLRPSAVEVLDQLEAIAATILEKRNICDLIYRSVESSEVSREQLEIQLSEKDRSLSEKEGEISHLQAEVLAKDAQIDHLRDEKKEAHDRFLDEISSLQQQLVAQREQIALLQGGSNVQASSSQERSTFSKAMASPGNVPIVPTSISIDFDWRKCEDVPQAMDVWDQPLVLNGKVYVRGTDVTGPSTVLEYTIDGTVGKWRGLPPPFLRGFTLAKVKNRLVVVGGKSSQSSLLMWDASLERWINPNYPSIPKERNVPSAVGYQEFLIVAGGNVSYYKIIDVNILDTSRSEWLIVDSLPHADDYYNPVVINDNVYLVGLTTKRVLRAHIPTLISKASSDASSVRLSAWEVLPSA